MNEAERRIEELIVSFQKTLLKRIEKQERTNRNLINEVYSQIESLFWLTKRLKLKNQLPSLRGWATSPDVLLKLHTYIIDTKPKCIVEFGSGASTIVIADALRQNGFGKLYSFDNSYEFGLQTKRNLERECLKEYVELSISPLVPWEYDHLNNEEGESPYWYDINNLAAVESVDLIWVDGPPGITCRFSRYPAVPAVIDKLHSYSQVWMDDTIREEETLICERWSEMTNMSLSFYQLEKGLGILSFEEECSSKLANEFSSRSSLSDSVISKLDFRKQL